MYVLVLKKIIVIKLWVQFCFKFIVGTELLDHISSIRKVKVYLKDDKKLDFCTYVQNHFLWLHHGSQRSHINTYMVMCHLQVIGHWQKRQAVLSYINPIQEVPQLCTKPYTSIQRAETAMSCNVLQETDFTGKEKNPVRINKSLILS